MPFAHLDGVDIYHELAGAGKRLLVVNGTGSDLRHQPNVFAWPLAKGFEVLGYDHRGLGRSTPTDPDHQPNMEDFANDALALASHVGWDSFSVFGMSFGGMVAQEIALRGGSRIERLVLAATSSGGLGNPSFPLHLTYAKSAKDSAQEMLNILDTRSASSPEVRAALQKMGSGQERTEDPTPGLLKQLEARSHHNTWDRLLSLSVPTLIAAGRYDGIAPLENSQALHRQIPNSILEVFEGGHIFMAEDRRCCPVFSEFLTS